MTGVRYHKIFIDKNWLVTSHLFQDCIICFSGPVEKGHAYMLAQLADKSLMFQIVHGACSNIFCTGKLGLTISHLSDLPNQNSKHLEGCHLPNAVGDSDLY